MPYAKKNTKSSRSRVPASAVSNKTVDKKMQKRDYRFKGSDNNNIKPEPFPRVLFTRAKFIDNEQLSVPAFGVSIAKTYRMNTIYRPSFTGSTSTVCGWAQLNAMYGNYLCLGAKVTVSYSNPTSDGCRVGVCLRQASSGPVTGLTLEQLANYTNTYISAVNNTGSQKKTFNFYIKPWSLVGINKLEYMANSSQYSSTMSSWPNAPCYIDVFAVNDDAGASAQTINYLIKVIYYVKCFNRLQLNPS